MNKYQYVLALVFLLCTGQLHAQFIKNSKKETLNNWQNLSPEKDGIYGADVNGAYDFLKGKKSKKKVTVALIGTGIDVEHEDLQGSLWINPKEKPNGRDDNKNGKIDDINGWNYLGNAQGEVLEKARTFADREYLRLKDKYSRIQHYGDKYVVVSDDEKELLEVAPPENKPEFDYFNRVVRKESAIGSKYSSIELMKVSRIYANGLTDKLKAKFPDKEHFSYQDFGSMIDRNDTDTLRMLGMTMISVAFMIQPQATWDKVLDYLNNFQPPLLLKDYQKIEQMNNFDDRTLIGDDPYKITDTKYGNNILLAENSGEGTSYAGIIGAKRSNDMGLDGIADNVQIMTLRTTPSEGEAYPKDVALAIRYAVDNGADIIQMYASASITPFGEQGDWINDALMYAESKGVLIVQPVASKSIDMDKYPYYPRKEITPAKKLSNMITVAASDKKGSPVPDSNFGIKSLDLYAPGKDIYSCYTGNTYREESGSEVAASTVTGVAALIKSYYPDLTAMQIRDIIINNVTDRSGEEVEKQSLNMDQGNAKMIKDLFLFEDLCASSGILNAAKAVEAASKLSKSN